MDDSYDSEISDNDFSYVLGSKSSITPSHPPPEFIYQLWQTFIDRVNPLTKVIHVPTLQHAIDKAVADMQHIPKGFEALMFAIYSTAVVSLTNEECEEMLGETRAALLPRYTAATKGALYRARFMSSTSIVVIQALLLHLLSIRDSYEPRAVWSLTGVAIRIAEGMGMGLDGTLLGLSPFEIEIRRRIWWQIKMHDFRAAELSGQSKMRHLDVSETTPKHPTNVNDSELYPAMSQPPVGSTKPTEMIWCMFRSDLASFAATQKSKAQSLAKTGATSEEYSAVDDVAMKDDFIKLLIDMIETKYLRFCDPSLPLQLMTLLGARITTNLMTFRSHHPRRWANLDQVPESEQRLVWSTVIQLLEQYSMLQSNPQLRPFAWNVPYFIQWEAVIHVLDTLRVKPTHIDANRAWKLIDALYENNSEILLSTNRPIFVVVGNVCLKAFDVRPIGSNQANRPPSGPPAYITKLREQRESATARRELSLSRRNGQDGRTTGERLAVAGASTVAPDANRSQEDEFSGPPLQKNPAPSQAFSLPRESLRNGDDAFWLSDALDDELLTGGAPDMMNLDTDAILAQDSYWLDPPNAGEVTDWAQWDTWFGNADPVRPSAGVPRPQ